MADGVCVRRRESRSAVSRWCTSTISTQRQPEQRSFDLVFARLHTRFRPGRSRSRRPGAKAEAERAASPRGRSPGTAETKRPAGKLGAILSAIDAADGATLEELTRLTGWQKHTVRAAISRLRPRGHDCRLDRADGRKAYRLILEGRK